MMQKQDGDRIEDFDKVYKLDDAFRMPFPPAPGTARSGNDESPVD
jgi:hypothetical protein